MVEMLKGSIVPRLLDFPLQLIYKYRRILQWDEVEIIQNLPFLNRAYKAATGPNIFKYQRINALGGVIWRWV